jgi:hypothetical protein
MGPLKFLVASRPTRPTSPMGARGTPRTNYPRVPNWAFKEVFCKNPPKTRFSNAPWAPGVPPMPHRTPKEGWSALFSKGRTPTSRPKHQLPRELSQMQHGSVDPHPAPPQGPQPQCEVGGLGGLGSICTSKPGLGPSNTHTCAKTNYPAPPSGGSQFGPFPGQGSW